MERVIRGPRGELSLRLRYVVESIVRNTMPKDRLSQMAAIYNWFNERFRYLNDPVRVELVKDPERILEEMSAHGVALGDCDDASTFLAAALRTAGIQSELMRVGFRNTPPGRLEGPFTHVLVRARDQYGRGIIVDPVAGQKTRRMISRVRQAKEGASEPQRNEKHAVGPRQRRSNGLDRRRLQHRPQQAAVLRRHGQRHARHLLSRGHQLALRGY